MFFPKFSRFMIQIAEYSMRTRCVFHVRNADSQERESGKSLIWFGLPWFPKVPLSIGGFYEVLPNWHEILSELSFIIGNIGTIAFWVLYCTDPVNVRAKEMIGKVNPIPDARAHWIDTSAFWFDLLFGTRHHVRLSLKLLMMRLPLILFAYFGLQ